HLNEDILRQAEPTRHVRVIRREQDDIRPAVEPRILNPGPGQPRYLLARKLAKPWHRQREHADTPGLRGLPATRRGSRPTGGTTASCAPRVPRAHTRFPSTTSTGHGD